MKIKMMKKKEEKMCENENGVKMIKSYISIILLTVATISAIIIIGISFEPSSLSSIIFLQTADATGHHNSYTVITEDGAEIPIHVPQSQTGGMAGKYGPGTTLSENNALDSLTASFSTSSRIVTYDTIDFDRMQFCYKGHVPGSHSNFNCDIMLVKPYHEYGPNVKTIGFLSSIQPLPPAPPAPPSTVTTPTTHSRHLTNAGLLPTVDTRVAHPIPTVPTDQTFKLPSPLELERQIFTEYMYESGNSFVDPLYLELVWAAYDNKYVFMSKVAASDYPQEDCELNKEYVTLNKYNIVNIPCKTVYVNYDSYPIPMTLLSKSLPSHPNPTNADKTQPGVITIYDDNDASFTNLNVKTSITDGEAISNRNWGAASNATMFEFIVTDKTDALVVNTESLGASNKRYSLFVVSNENFLVDLARGNPGVNWKDASIVSAYGDHMKYESTHYQDTHHTKYIYKTTVDNQKFRILAFDNPKCTTIGGLTPGFEVTFPKKSAVIIPDDGKISWNKCNEELKLHNADFKWRQPAPGDTPPNLTPPGPVTTITQNPDGSFSKLHIDYFPRQTLKMAYLPYIFADRVPEDRAKYSIDVESAVHPLDDVIIDQKNNYTFLANINPDKTILYSNIAYVKIPIGAATLKSTQLVQKYSENIYLLHLSLHRNTVGGSSGTSGTTTDPNDSTIELPYLLGKYMPGEFAYVPVIPGYDYMNITLGRPLLTSSLTHDAVVSDTILKYDDVLGAPTIHLSSSDRIVKVPSKKFDEQQVHGSINTTVHAYHIPTIHGNVRMLYDIAVSGNMTIDNIWNLEPIPQRPAGSACIRLDFDSTTWTWQATRVCDPMTVILDVYKNGELHGTLDKNVKLANDRDFNAVLNNMTWTPTTANSIVTYDYPELVFSNAAIVPAVAPGDFIEFVMTIELSGFNMGINRVDEDRDGMVDDWIDTNGDGTLDTRIGNTGQQILNSTSLVYGWFDVRSASVQTSQ